MRISVKRWRKAQDRDNSYASVKPLVDAIKHWGWLYDDDPAHVDLYVEEEAVKSRKDQLTTVEWWLPLKSFFSLKDANAPTTAE